ncbi:oligosaccharide flippase family protein [Akkermansiaceae bacterium]|nr:oligosaccharide flippase family protein [bacterium]MDB4730510.1 oligosaccharide flippase family protein [Akkermansiaceae bacterium]MDB4753081.1 oligosaccharide flippase family protein [bacterium]MDC0270361.1 oligosaccharide flippase family protein [bacterium]
MKSNSAQLKGGVLISYFTLVVGNIIPLFYTPYVVRTLGMEEYGLYSLAKSITDFLILLNLGLGAGVLKYVNQAIAEKDNEARDNVFTLFVYCHAAIFLAVLLVGAVISMGAGNIFGAIPPDLHLKLRILIGVVTISTALSMFSSVYTAVVQAHQRFVFAKLAGLLVTFIVPALSAFLLWVGYRSVAMVTAGALIGILYGAAHLIYVHRVLGIRFVFGELDTTPLKSIFHFSKYILLGAIANTLFAATDRVLLGMYASASAIAVYSVGVTFCLYFETMVRNISDLLFPKINTMLAQGANMHELDSLILKVGRLQSIFLGLILCGFIVLGDDFLSLWVGAEYESAYWIALLVMVPVSIPLLQSCGPSALRAMNKHGFRSWVFCFIAILNVIGSLWAVQRWGAVGCAAVTCVSYLIGPVIIMNIYYRVKIGLDIASFWRSIFRMSGAFIVMLSAGLALKPYLMLDGWVQFFATAGCFSALYCVILWFTGLNRYEKGMILGFLSKLNLSRRET